MKQGTYKLKISGRVQGVGFRAWTRDRAGELGLRGKVKNLPDGTVESTVQGPEEDVAKFITLLWKGPLLASVKSVEKEIVESDVKYNDFKIQY